MNRILEQLNLGAPKRVLIFTLRPSVRHHFLRCFWHALHLVKKWQNLRTIHWFSKKKSQWHGVQGTVQLGLFVFIHEFHKTSHRKENLLSEAQSSWQILVPEKLFRLENFLQTQIQTAGQTENVICCISFHHKTCNRAPFSEWLNFH